MAWNPPQAVEANFPAPVVKKYPSAPPLSFQWEVTSAFSFWSEGGGGGGGGETQAIGYATSG